MENCSEQEYDNQSDEQTEYQDEQTETLEMNQLEIKTRTSTGHLPRKIKKEVFIDYDSETDVESDYNNEKDSDFDIDSDEYEKPTKQTHKPKTKVKAKKEAENLGKMPAKPVLYEVHCIYCQKCFIAVEWLKMHLSNVHKLAHMCDLCHQAFPDTCTLLKHNTEKHSRQHPARKSISSPRTRNNKRSDSKVAENDNAKNDNGKLEKMESEEVSYQSDTVEDTLDDTVEDTLDDTVGDTVVGQEEEGRAKVTETVVLDYDLFNNGELLARSKAMKVRHKMLNELEGEYIDDAGEYRNKFGDVVLPCTVPECTSKFVHINFLRAHLRRVHMKKNKCRFCGKSFGVKRELDRHERIHVRDVDARTCPICNKTYSSESQVKYHIRRMHERNLSCPLCKKRFGIIADVRRHVRECQRKMQPVENMVKCTLCAGEYSTLKYLHNHIKRVHKKSLKCPYDSCTSSFGIVSSLNRHIRESHQGKYTGRNIRKDITCKVCDKVLNSQKSMDSHMKYVHGKKNLKCPYCEKKFTEKGRLNHHLLKSHDVKATRSRDYKQMDNSKRVKAVKCSICRMGFDTKAELAEHTKVHKAVLYIEPVKVEETK